MTEYLELSFSSIQSVLDAHDLSFDKLPNLEEWHNLLAYLDKREKQIEFLGQTAVDIPDALVFIFDADMIIVATNTKAAVSLGFQSEHEIIGKHAKTFINPEDYDASIARFNAIIRGETLPEYERTLHRPDGSVVHTILNLSLIENVDTGAKFVKSVMRDVTKLRNAEAEAQQYQEHLNKVLENTPVVLWSCDKDGIITFSHGMGLNSIGRKSGQSVDKNIFELYSDYPLLVQYVEKALQGEEQHFQIEIQGATFNSWIQPTYENDILTGLVGVSTDISELADAHAQVRNVQESTERTLDYLQAILNNSSDGIAVATNEGRIQQTNPAFNDLFDLEPDDAFSHQLYDYLADSEKYIVEQAIEFATRTKMSLRFESSLRNPDTNGDIYVDVSCSPISTKTDGVHGLMFSVRDITAYRELLQKTSESRDEALNASNLKSEFLAMMSHVVRTPLHAIMGVAEMIQDTNLEEEQRELVDLIQEQSDQLLEMLNSILDYSKLEAQKMILERKAFKVKEWVEITTKQFKGQAWNKGIELQTIMELPDELYIYGDAQRLRQVITSFTSNAIKFTEAGEVIVACTLRDKTENQATLHFNIADTGIGIPEEKIHTLFSPFTQADSSHTRRYGGTGLGLAIAHRILNLMKSEIQVQSVVGKGTNFEFTIIFDLATAS